MYVSFTYFGCIALTISVTSSSTSSVTGVLMDGLPNSNTSANGRSGRVGRACRRSAVRFPVEARVNLMTYEIDTFDMVLGINMIGL